MNKIRKNVTTLAIAGNILFLLWILYYGIPEGFSGTLIEKISFNTIMGLLATNAFLPLANNKAGKLKNCIYSQPQLS